MLMSQFLNTVVFTEERKESWLEFAQKGEYLLNSKIEGDYAPFILFIEDCISAELNKANDECIIEDDETIEDYLVESLKYLQKAIYLELTTGSSSLVDSNPYCQDRMIYLIEVLIPFSRRVNSDDLEFDDQGFAEFLTKINANELFESFLDIV